MARFGEKYELIEQIGKGGMGVVYKAKDLQLDRPVALKLLPRNAANHANAVDRFIQEGKLVGAFQHPNIVVIHEAAMLQGYAYQAMEFLAGGTLKEKCDGRPFPARQAAELVATLAEAMHHVHERGIVHRDLKPLNVVYDKGGTPKIVDFGLAKRANQQGLTKPGYPIGTPEYMAPEQARGDANYDRQTDVYGLGGILYYLVTGRPPFAEKQRKKLLAAVESKDPLPPRNIIPTIPADLEEICLKCLKKAKSSRFATAYDLALALRRFLEEKPVQSVVHTEAFRPWWKRTAFLAPSATVFAAVFAAVWFFFLRPEGQAPISNPQRAGAEEKATDEDANTQGEPQNNGILPLANSEERSPPARKGSPRPPSDIVPKVDWPGGIAFPKGPWREATPPPTVDVPLVKELTGHTGRVRCLAFSADGKMLVTGSDDSTVRVSNVAEGRLLKVLKGHASPISCVAISPDQSLIAAGDSAQAFERTVRVWKLSTGEKLSHLILKENGTGSELFALAFSDDGKKVAVGGHWKVVVWDRVSGQTEVLQTFRSSGDFAYALAFSSQSKQEILAAGCYEHSGGSNLDTVRVWALPSTSKEPTNLTVDADFLWETRGSIAFASNGEKLAQVVPGGLGVRREPKVHLWHLLPKPRLETYDGPEGGIYAAVVTDDGIVKVATAKGMSRHGDFGQAIFGKPTPTNHVRLWDSISCRTWTLESGHKETVVNVAFSRDGKLLATASDDCTVRIWNLTGLKNPKNHGP